MPSFQLGYVPGSGYAPLISGNPWSGTFVPTGGLQIVADKNNSGNIYVSFSGGNYYSGQLGVLPTSGGPTITSGGVGNYTSGLTDGMQIQPGGAYFIPRTAIHNTGPTSGTYAVCIGCDAPSSGQARVYFEMI